MYKLSVLQCLLYAIVWYTHIEQIHVVAALESTRHAYRSITLTTGGSRNFQYGVQAIPPHEEERYCLVGSSSRKIEEEEGFKF